MDENKNLLFKLVEGQGRIEQKVDDTNAIVRQNCADIRELKGKPARRLEKIVSAVIAAVVAAIIAIFTKKI
jgi:uncharacterized protein YcfJ